MEKQANRAAEGADSIQGYFRPIIEQNPKKYLKSRDNSELYERWLKDHPDHDTVPESVKNSLNNLKSRMRKDRKMGRRRKAAASDEPTASAAAAPARAARRAAGNLQALEEQIDECLGMARNIDREGLTRVIELLRDARNQVIARAVGAALSR